MGDLQLIHADARALPLKDESAQCIVTSPPYWGLRQYAGEQESVWPAAGRNACATNEHEWVSGPRKHGHPDRSSGGEADNYLELARRRTSNVQRPLGLEAQI